MWNLMEGGRQTERRRGGDRDGKGARVIKVCCAVCGGRIQAMHSRGACARFSGQDQSDDNASDVLRACGTMTLSLCVS